MWTYHRVQMLKWLYALSPGKIYAYEKRYSYVILDYSFSYKHLIRAWKELKEMKFVDLW
jgi:hypothetical protein